MGNSGPEELTHPSTHGELGSNVQSPPPKSNITRIYTTHCYYIMRPTLRDNPRPFPVLHSRGKSALLVQIHTHISQVASPQPTFCMETGIIQAIVKPKDSIRPVEDLRTVNALSNPNLTFTASLIPLQTAQFPATGLLIWNSTSFIPKGAKLNFQLDSHFGHFLPLKNYKKKKQCAHAHSHTHKLHINIYFI